MNFKVIHEIAGRVFAGGSGGIAEIDPATGEIVAESDNGLHHWDVTRLSGGSPAGIVLDQRNGPGLRVYTDDLSSSYVVQPPVEGKTGRIVSDGARDYWLTGGKVKQFHISGRVIDIGRPAARDIVCVQGGFAVLENAVVAAYDDNGNQSWVTVLPAMGYYLRASDDGRWVAAWGRAYRDQKTGTLTMPMVVLDAVTGEEVVRIDRTGLFLAVSDVAIEGGLLYVGRPDRRNNVYGGAVDVYDFDGVLQETIELDANPINFVVTAGNLLWIAGNDQESINVLELTVNEDDEDEDEIIDVDPFEAFVIENELTGNETQVFELLRAIAPSISVSIYPLILANMRR